MRERMDTSKVAPFHISKAKQFCIATAVAGAIAVSSLVLTLVARRL